MFAPGPRAVGFTIVWPEGVIFRSMMTYHVQFLLLVLAGWVNRQHRNRIIPTSSVGLSHTTSYGVSGQELTKSRGPLYSRNVKKRSMSAAIRFACVEAFLSKSTISCSSPRQLLQLTPSREVKILMRLPDGRNVATRHRRKNVLEKERIVRREKLGPSGDA